MGVGSFGGFNSGAAFMVMNHSGGKFGGYDSNDNKEDEKPKSKFNWIWFTINLFLFSVSLYTLICISSDFTKYIRVGNLIEKNQSAYKVKQNYYPDYYFTVKWNDRAKEVEVFGVGAATYFGCKPKETVYFKRIKQEYEWINKGTGLFCLFVCGFAWIMSGFAALIKNW